MEKPKAPDVCSSLRVRLALVLCLMRHGADQLFQHAAHAAHRVSPLADLDLLPRGVRRREPARRVAASSTTRRAEADQSATRAKFSTSQLNATAPAERPPRSA